MDRRYVFRRLAVQTLSKNAVLRPNTRSFSNASPSILFNRSAIINPRLQKRWASNEASEDSVPPSNFTDTPEPSTESQESESVSSMISSAASAASDAASSAGSSVYQAASSAGRAIKPPAAGPQLYVGNLFFEITEQDLKEKFGEFGTVNDVKVIRDPRGMSKGYVSYIPAI